MGRFTITTPFYNTKTGRALPFSRLFFFENETISPKDTFSDPLNTQVNPNPVVADGSGQFGDIFLQDTPYTVELRDRNNVTQWKRDNVLPQNNLVPSDFIIEDNTVLADGQTVVSGFTEINANLAAFYLVGQNIDQGRLKKDTDYTVDSPSQITLSRSYPAGTILQALQFEPTQSTPVTGEILVFDTVGQLKGADLMSGQVVRVIDQNVFDDGQGRFLVVQTPGQFGGTPDEELDFALDNGNIAKTLPGQGIFLLPTTGRSGTPVMRSNVKTSTSVGSGTNGAIDLTPRITRLVDGRFDFWFESTGPQTTSGFGSDTMWRNENSGSTKVHSQETLVLGTDIPEVPSAEFYSRTVVTSVPGAANFVFKNQRIESVRTYAGQTVTVSFFARVDASQSIAVSLQQNFGTGGSPSSAVTINGQKTQITNAFQRFSFTFDVPDLSGKTIGTNDNDYLELRFWYDAGSNFDSETDALGQQSGTFDLACVQIDVGSAAKPFYEFDPKEALDRVNRYFVFNNVEAFANIPAVISNGVNTLLTFDLPTVMRVSPIVNDGGNIVWSTAAGSATGFIVRNFLNNKVVLRNTGGPVPANFATGYLLETGVGSFLSFDARL